MNREEALQIVREAREEEKKPDLTGADLRWANLSEADLRWANLSWADLTGTDLTGTDLRGANMSGAIGAFSVYSCGRHYGWAAGGRIGIGCEIHDYQHWLDHGIEIGKANRYSEAEIKRYMAWVVSTVEWLREED